MVLINESRVLHKAEVTFLKNRIFSYQPFTNIVASFITLLLTPLEEKMVYYSLPQLVIKVSSNVDFGVSTNFYLQGVKSSVINSTMIFLKSLWNGRSSKTRLLQSDEVFGFIELNRTVEYSVQIQFIILTYFLKFQS